MDEAVDDEVTAVGAPDGAHILSKEHEYSLKPSNSNIVVSHQPVTPHEGNESAAHLFIDILDGKNLDRKGSSEQTSVSPRSMADSSVMVEELTVRNYNGENIAVVGTSNDRDGVQSRQNQCQHFYQRASGAGSASSLGEAANGDKSQITSSVWEDVENFYLPDSLDQNQITSGENHHDSMDDLPGNGDKSLSSNIFRSGVRTKILSKSGFSEYFVKNTLKGKGIICKGPVHRRFGDGSGSQTYSKSANTGLLGSNAQLSSTLDIAMPITSSLAETWPSMSINPVHDEVILRDWLIAGQNKLLSSFDSRRSHEAAMLDLRNRILPPELLSENPKEAGFCLWLLHPEPSSRPTTSTILQSEVICGIQDLAGDELVSSIEKEDAESELMLHFFFTLKEQKQRDASRLAEEIRFIEADIQEVEKRQTKELPVASSLPRESLAAKGIFLHSGHINADFYPKLPPLCDEKLMRNIRQLESAYFSMRSNIQLPERDVTTRGDRELLRLRENWLSEKNGGMCKTTDRVGGFFTDLCKYAHYNKFKARGVLRNGDLANSANVICSLSFDRDEDYLAAGGVSKKIKIFNFHALFDDSVDIHYPVIEMSNKSKLSCICWNSYIRNYLASTDHDGTVKLWDAATGQNFSEFVEHDERAWSVDFSRLDPIKLASGSDDRLVKLWSINERNSLCTIRNNANVCCVQFSAESTYLLAFSSADCKIYCYDLRNISTPWCILAGHEKAVSYAKFLDAETLVSASTDNTLKIWDLSKTSSNGLSRDACILTLRGHTNEKNFVGLSVADGYISCGSETNEVFAYYRSLPMPITSLKFGSIDPISGKETDDDNGQFVSSVCWRRKSDMVIAANSTGCIKLLEMM